MRQILIKCVKNVSVVCFLQNMYAKYASAEIQPQGENILVLRITI